MAQNASKRKKENLWVTLGNFLYAVGFQAEYMFVRFFNLSDTVLLGTIFIGKWLKNGVIGLFRPLLRTIGYEIMSPWRQVSSAWGNIGAMIREQRAAGKSVGNVIHQVFAYLTRGFRLYKGAVHRASTYLLPLGAGVAFALVVYTTLTAQYALKITANNEFIGYVDNITVYDEAISYVKDRIRNSEGADSWSLEPEFELVSINKAGLYSKTEVADSIVKRAGSEIQNGVGVLVDDKLIGVVSDAEGKKLQTDLTAIRSAALDPARPNMRVEFIQKVEVVPGVYLTGSVQKELELMSVLRGEQPMLSQKGDSVSTNYLRVQQIERNVFDAEIPFEEQEVQSDTLKWGEEKITQVGVAGLKSVTQDVVYIDGAVANIVTVEENVLRDAVAQITSYGILNKYGAVAGAVGDGNLIWPVPGYKGISRGMQYGHRGVDITGAAGTPIYACDSGIVEFGGNALGTANWSYGNYVKIDHGNGITTLYGHMRETAVKTGDYVTKGDLIGYMGSTGNSSGNHCHLEVMKNGMLSNPYNYVTVPR